MDLLVINRNGLKLAIIVKEAVGFGAGSGVMSLQEAVEVEVVAVEEVEIVTVEVVEDIDSEMAEACVCREVEADTSDIFVVAMVVGSEKTVALKHHQRSMRYKIEKKPQWISNLEITSIRWVLDKTEMHILTLSMPFALSGT